MSTDTVLVKFAGIAKEFSVSQTLDLGFTTVRWYGAIIAFGFLLAVLFGGRIAYKWKINLDKMVDVLIYGTIGGIIGARLYYVAFKWDYYGSHLGDIVKIWEGGLAIYGGLIGGLIAAYIVCKVEKLNMLNLMDMASMSFLIGQGIGRWGNYANQEAFGSITNKSWGMMSDTVVSYISSHADYFGLENVDNIPQYIAENDLYVHPTFFYESVWCLLGFAVLYIIMRKYRKFSGQLFLTYGVWYGFERTIVEGMRSDSLYIGNSGIRVSQLISLALMLVCLALLIALLVKYTKHPKPIEGIDYFPPKTEKEIAAEKKKQEKKAMRQKMKAIKIRDGKIIKDEITEDIKTETE
ncbi:MAG: prolipoprotein diacylglyceryl transferase [Faecalibacterium sp.]|nr:prolipoprotein diacylglyceryl transferase [Ruminococcus sp.]MCM1392029.1 prolipoprotein diacylglyceryl transferase [Ruminococcus sp.]MCM1484836.1 prolipoprotein diacylglyceryl transferase [Faecalibacterium sp.]